MLIQYTDVRYNRSNMMNPRRAVVELLIFILEWMLVNYG